MVNSLRPLANTQPRSPSRRSSTTSSSSHHHHDPAPPHHHIHHDAHPATPASVRANDERPAKRVKVSLKGPRAPATRRPANHDAHNIPRPPTKLTVAEPHGQLLQTTNGVRTTLGVIDDGLNSNTSGGTTPDPSAPQRTARKAEDRRSLRSHDEGSRLKSELAVYFPYYEHVINDIPQEPELVDVDTVIQISDEPYQPPARPTKVTSRAGNTPSDNHSRHQYPISPSKQPLSPSKDKHRFNGAQVIDFSSIEKSVGHHPKDPLTDAVYFKSHRRAERKEKQLRNIEKERAMHEKAQLERLLDGLQGHDWLRVLGVTGVTDSESKKYEIKRNYFVDEVKALLLKFKMWKEEERRLKMEKEAAADAEEEVEAEEAEEEATGGGEEESEGEPSSSDIDASAARQLQMEASGGVKGKSKQRAPQAPRPRPRPPSPRPQAPTEYRSPTPEGPFVSFYRKAHMRAAGLGKSRHGRNSTAFGQPAPEPDEREFALPDDYVTEDVLKDNARRRRRKKRESAVDASTAKN